MLLVVGLVLGIPCVLGVVGAILLPAIVRAKCRGREASAKRLVEELSIAAETYRSDWGVYPEGTGTGTSVLASRLKTPGSRGMAYFELQAGALDPSGNVENPVSPEDEILYSRNNRVNFPGNVGDPSVHNRQTFDLWGRDCAGAETGINNWE